MRIIAGKHRGRKLFTPKDDTVIRPTTDFTREALFNLIRDGIMGAEVLDLFGGTGAVACEFLSRGAAHVTICDKSNESLSLIRKNIDLIGETAEVIAGDYLGCLSRVRGKRFSHIFLDPPYAMAATPILSALLQASVVREDTMVIYEHDSATPVVPPNGMCIAREKRYGRVMLTFLKREIAE